MLVQEALRRQFAPQVPEAVKHRLRKCQSNLNHAEKGFALGQADVLTDLGNVVRKRGNHSAAKSYYMEALGIYRKHRIRLKQPIICGKLGTLALNQGHLSEAQHWFKHELDLAQELGREISFASAKLGLASVLKQQGNCREALSLAEEALRIHKRLHHRDREETQLLVTQLQEELGIGKENKPS